MTNDMFGIDFAPSALGYFSADGLEALCKREGWG